MNPGGKKMAGYWKLAGIWRRETNDSRRGIFFWAVKWNDPSGMSTLSCCQEREKKRDSKSVMRI